MFNHGPNHALPTLLFLAVSTSGAFPPCRERLWQLKGSWEAPCCWSPSPLQGERDFGNRERLQQQRAARASPLLRKKLRSGGGESSSSPLLVPFSSGSGRTRLWQQGQKAQPSLLCLVCQSLSLTLVATHHSVGAMCFSLYVHYMPPKVMCRVDVERLGGSP